MSEFFENMDGFEEEIEVMEITDDMEADEFVQQIKEAQEDKARWKEFYDDRYRKVCESCDQTIAFNTIILQKYFENVPHKVTKTQENYALPTGKLVIKKQAPEFERDDEEVIKWLKENGGERFIKTTESLDWAALKATLSVVGDAAADENGNVIPCITVNERPDVFKVEIKKEG